MADRGKVIELFSSCISKGGWNNCTNCEHGKAQAVLTCKPLAEDVLKVLKEQPQIVRCKDCKWFHCGNCVSNILYEMEVNEDWFCAYGEKRSD